MWEKGLILLLAVFLVCVNCSSVSGFLDTKHVKGVQIKNRGHERLLIQMTGEESFILPPRQMASLIVESNWTGIIFSKSEECKYRKCNTPYTIAELKFGGQNGQDQYRVSVKDGFNRPIIIQPTSLFEYCKPAGCTVDLNTHCPQNLQVKNENGKLIACKKATETFKKLCPSIVTSDQDEENNTLYCKTDEYVITIDHSNNF